MREHYIVYYKSHPLSNALELHEALKKLEQLRYLFKNLHIERLEVK